MEPLKSYLPFPCTKISCGDICGCVAINVLIKSMIGFAYKKVNNVVVWHLGEAALPWMPRMLSTASDKPPPPIPPARLRYLSLGCPFMSLLLKPAFHHESFAHTSRKPK